MRPHLEIVRKPSAQPTIPERSTASGSRCLFLDLPAELRAMIYEYALTEKDGLIMDSSYRYSAHTASQKCDANQLKLVCKQLHAETRGLGLLYNSLTIQDSIHRVWFGNFRRFADHTCSPKIMSRLTEVILHDQIGRFEDLVRHKWSRGRGVRPLRILENQLNAICSPSFVTCCQKLPIATITIRLEVCRTHPDFFLWAEIGSLVQYLFRGTESRMLKHGMLWTWKARALVQKFLDRHGSSPFPPNLRLTPASYVVAHFRQWDDFDRMNPNLRIEWLAQGESWYKNGF